MSVPHLFWLSDEQWAVIAPFMPESGDRAGRADDRRVISGILHVVRSECIWAACPAEYGISTTIYSRFDRWSRRGFWTAMRRALAEAGWPREAAALDRTAVRAWRSGRGRRGGES